MSNKQQFFLNLFSKTWARDSHGLYDYESSQTKNFNAVLSESVVISRKKHDVKITKASKEEINDDELLLNLKYETKTKYIIDNPVGISMQPSEKNITDLSNKIWYVLNYNDSTNSTTNHTCVNTNDDYYLKKNDIIKLGRVKYSLNEINHQAPPRLVAIPNEMNAHLVNYNLSEINLNTSPVFDFIFLAKAAEDEINDENMCKICYCNSNDRENPLVHLCSCTGGIRFAHYVCIKKWMKTKLTIKENEKKTVKSYSIRQFNCEICKTPYPFRFKINSGKKCFDLIEIVRPEKEDYIMLESLNQVKDNCNIKSIHIIKLTDDPIIIGRGHESDVRVNDISVSRTHGWLKYDKETRNLLLRDLKSKFGTLVLFKKPLELKEKKIHLQIGRTYIEAKLIKSDELEAMQKEKKVKQVKHLPNKVESSKALDINNVLAKEIPIPLSPEDLLSSLEKIIKKINDNTIN